MVTTYQNPLSIKNSGDPFVLRAPGGKYYCYATSAVDGFKAWSSENLVHWKEEGYVYLRREDSWGIADFWAPEVVFYYTKYFMHYSAHWSLGSIAERVVHNSKVPVLLIVPRVEARTWGIRAQSVFMLNFF